MINKGDIVKVKEEYAFDVSSHYHYGEVVNTDLNEFGTQEIYLKADLRYTHDSIIWIDAKYYEKVKEK